MIHVGTIVAAGLSQGKSTSFSEKLPVRILFCFRFVSWIVGL